MAAPTETRTNFPHTLIELSGTNVDAGNHDYTVSQQQARMIKGFSIITGTLTAMTVTVIARIGSRTLDITNELFGVANLASDKWYNADIPVNVSSITIRAVRSNATNALALSAFFNNN